MARHNHRTASESHHHFADTLPSAVATSSMYAHQPQQVPPSYYTLPPGPDSASLQVSTTQQTSYNAYPADAANLPPNLHRASSGAWSPEADDQLIMARTQGLNWSQIKSAYFPSKSANACRKRHERLVEYKNADDWDARKLESLAKAYMSMRKEIWSGLAARTGEKWNVVEAKCMSNGLKNLQSAARAASRRDRLDRLDRLENRSHDTGYDDDSGISSSLTSVDDLDASHSSPERGSGSPVGAAHSFTSSSAPSGAGFHQLHGYATIAPQTTHVHLHPAAGNGDQGSYGLNAYGASYSGQHYEHSSSASSTASVGQAHRRYPSRGSSPYADGQRVPNADMGIDILINPSGGRRA
ncbi:hypothetical protein E4U43_004524 [Claviceps pusilla]|uniref:Myb-like domain-containing protein n=1 Tax=Claviceps pusilla TaxID=123648 RepID=A0A9P7N5F0_9HYPO|nr:hypothetical protein E4U43_004524 [Claviceps pusilla]